jgi:hypothetical protein
VARQSALPLWVIAGCFYKQDRVPISAKHRMNLQAGMAFGLMPKA